MRFKIATAAALAAATLATPAMANEGRAEIRGGVLFGNGAEEAVAGMAAGYDWSLGDAAFFGFEVSADKVFASDFEFSLGASARAGANISEQLKAYVAGGYASAPCDLCEDAWSAGGGLQFAVSDGAYVKAEYRHLFSNNGAPDLDAVVVGVGFAM